MNRVSRGPLSLQTMLLAATMCNATLFSLELPAISSEEPVMTASDRSGRVDIYGTPSVETLRTILTRYEQSRRGSSSISATTATPTQAAGSSKDGLRSAYINDLQRRIKRAWFPKGDEFKTKTVILIFKIHRGGELSNLRIDHSSGIAVADQSALKAVENAAPFPPLPSELSDDADIRSVFNVDAANTVSCTLANH